MKVKRFPLLMLLSGLLCLNAGARATADNTTGDVLVQLQQNANLQQILSYYGVTIKAKSAAPNTFVLTPPMKLDPATLASWMSVDTRVAAAAPNYVTCAAEFAVKPTNQWTSVFDGSNGPTFYTAQLAVSQVNYNQAARWANGSGVMVAILDTGISTRNPLLAAQTATGWNFVDGNSNADDCPYNLDDDGDGVPDEAVGHGTMLAGLVARFAPHATLLPVRVLNSEGHGTLANVVDGINYAVARGARVINLSFGFSQNIPLLTSTLDNARKKGVLIVVAAGNTNSTVAQAPAGYAGALTVAGVDGNNQKASFSSYGPYVDVCAPAVNITSTFWDGRYATWSGTSFAAPIVSAQAALLFSSEPGSKADDVAKAIINSSHSVNAWNPLYINMLGKKNQGLIDFDASFDEL